jgi:hypothetical protein
MLHIAVDMVLGVHGLVESIVQTALNILNNHPWGTLAVGGKW